eukprot:TRINITY_DN16815_c0_g1_i6.p2 TRINITY_DN16815_c0_g1~~TRINITY_DN16815_c0_g1_i6.p2  ORF type:complete len:151 (-),score=16.96 TRINITY_DN16815_c0_g1_i6:93-545(-)
MFGCENLQTFILIFGQFFLQRSYYNLASCVGMVPLINKFTVFKQQTKKRLILERGVEQKIAGKMSRVQKIMTQPINVIFRFLQSRQKISIWLFDNPNMRLEGKIIGFDEYMNLVLDEAEEVMTKKNTRVPLGRILLRGDNITLMQTVAVK